MDPMDQRFAQEDEVEFETILLKTQNRACKKKYSRRGIRVTISQLTIEGKYCQNMKLLNVCRKVL
jgi:hypothetical protein